MIYILKDLLKKEITLLKLIGNMEKNFVTYEQALALNELGFDEPCFTFYNGKSLDFKISDNDGAEAKQINTNMDIGLCVNAPLKSQVFKWFDDTTFTNSEDKPFKLRGIVLHKETGYFGYEIRTWEFNNNIGKWKRETCLKSEQFRLDMESYCIDKLIEIVKNK